MSYSDSFKKGFASVMSVAVLALALFATSATPAKADWTSQRLIKTSTSSAVYLQDGGSRFVFPHSVVYFSWFPDFSGVQTISQAEMQSIPLGGNVYVRAGTDFIQFHSGANMRGYDSSLPVYLVWPNGKLQRVPAGNASAQAALAQAYGSNWSSKVIKLNDAFFTGYQVVAEYSTAGYPDGQLFQYAGDPQTYIVMGGMKRAVTSDAFNLNRFQSKYIVTAPSSLTFSNGPALNSAEPAFSILGNQGSGSSTPTTSTGAVTASLDASNPASTFVPQGAQQVPMLSFKLMSGNEAATINSIVVHRYGAGSASNFDNVYLYDGNTRLTLGRSINSSTNEATFTGLNLSLPANSSKVLTLTADISNSASGAVGAFEITANTDITGPATVSGTFPLRGNLFSFTSATTGKLTITRTGAPSNPRVGDTNVLLSSFQLQAGSAEDLTIKRIAVYQSGSIRNTDLKNLKLYQAGNVVASASGIDSKNLITFNFDTPFSMLKGDTKTFDIKGDIDLAARVGTTVAFYLDQKSDLFAVGNTYGFGVNVDNSGGNAYSSATAIAPTGLVTLTGAQLTTQFTGPASTELATNTQNVTIYTGKMSAGANIEVRKVSVTLDSSAAMGTTSAAYYTNIKLVNADTNQLLFGPTDLANSAATTQTIDLQGPYTFTTGQSVNFKITANLNSAITPDSTIRITLKAIDTGDVRNLDSGINVAASDIVPNTALAGNTHTVRASGLSVILSNSPSNQSYTRGTLGKDLIGIIVKASNAQAVTLRQLNLQTYIGPTTGSSLCGPGLPAYFHYMATSPIVDCSATKLAGEGLTDPSPIAVAAKDRISTIQLIDQGTGQAIGQLESLDNNGLVTFDNLNLNIPAGASKTLLARFDISNNAILTTANAFMPYRLSGSITTSSMITAVDSQGNSANVTLSTTPLNNFASVSTAVTVIGQGSVSAINIADVDVQPKLVVGGSNNVNLGKFRFSAVNEDITIEKLKVQVLDSLDNPFPNNVQGIFLVDGSDVYGQGGKGATQPVSIDNSGIARFDGLNIVVPKDGQKTITVRINSKTISGGASTGSQFKVALVSNNSNTASGEPDVQAKGNSITLYGLDVIGSQVVSGQLSKIFRSVPTVSSVTTGLNTQFETGPAVKLYKFTVAADAAGDIELNKLTFNVSKNTDVNVSDYVLYDVSSGNEQALNTASPTNPVIVPTSPIVVPAGSTKTFELRAQVSVGGLGGDIISTSLAGGDAMISSSTYSTVAGSSNFVWSDISAQAHGLITSDWNNGHLVQTLPTTSFSKSTNF